jgi:hypothetical protein
VLRIKGLCIVGVRTVWHTEGDGEFFCTGCGGDRAYRRRVGTRRLTVFGLPLLGRGRDSTVVECVACRDRFGPEVLGRPTTALLSAMLRDAVYTVALAILTAGGASEPATRETAVSAVRSAGVSDCTEDQLLGLLAAIVADEGRFPGAAADWGPGGLADSVDGCGGWLSIELHEALEPLAAHLAPEGRQHILLQGARIAVSDGPYLPAEREVLGAAGRCLGLLPEEVARLLDAASGTPS